MIVLVTGGSGCGKSTWAEKLVASLPNENRVYIATMQVYDEESVKRVERHRAQRADKGFRTIECEKDLASTDIEDDSIVLLEDLVYKDVIFDTSPVAGKVYKNSENRRKQGVSCGFRCIVRCSIDPVRAQPRYA